MRKPGSNILKSKSFLVLFFIEIEISNRQDNTMMVKGLNIAQVIKNAKKKSTWKA